MTRPRRHEPALAPADEALALIGEYGDLRERVGALAGSARANLIGELRQQEAALLARIGALLLGGQNLSAAEATVQFRAGHRGNADRVLDSIESRQNNGQNGE